MAARQNIGQWIDKDHCFCVRCQTVVTSVQMFDCHSTLWGKKKIPICKKCLTEIIEDWHEKQISIQDIVQRFCIMFDVYWEQARFDRCDKTQTYPNIVKDYFIRAARTKGKTLEDSIKEGFRFLDEQEEIDVGLEDIPRRVQKFWGPGFSSEEYSIMQSHYEELKNGNPSITDYQETLIRELCGTHMRKQQALRECDIDNFKKLSEVYRAVFKDSGLKMVSSMSDDDKKPFGLTLRDICRYSPEYIYKDQEAYSDSNGFEEYMKRHMERPLNNILKTSDGDMRDPEYSIGGDSDETENPN